MGFHIALESATDMNEKEWVWTVSTPEEKAPWDLSIGLDIVVVLSMGLGRLAAVVQEGGRALEAGKAAGAAPRAMAILGAVPRSCSSGARGS